MEVTSTSTYIYMEIQQLTKLILSLAEYPDIQEDIDATRFVEASSEQVDTIKSSTPGSLHYLEENGTIRVEPPPPPPIRYAQQNSIDAQVRTTDATVLEVFRFPCAEKHLYRANLRIAGIDTDPTMISLVQEGRFVWKRSTGDAILEGVTVVSQIPTTIPIGWLTNCFPQGTDIVFTVKGPSDRIIDWLLVGEVGTFAPEGLG